MTGGDVWVNGERRPDAPHIDARDRGLTLADGLFETMHARGGRVFRLDRHLARLDAGASRLAIDVPASLRQWVADAARHAAGESSVRLTVTRGPGSGGVSPPAGAVATVIVTVAPLPPFPRETYESGLRAHVASGSRNEHAITAGLKTLSYTDSVAALIEARRAGADEAIFLDTSGHCSEATASNLFICAAGALLTPPLTCGVLPGVTREAVLDLAAAAGLDAFERPFGLDALLAADEAFLTSSLRQIAPLVRVNGADIGTGRPGEITRRLAEAYRRMVDAEIG